MAPVSRPRPVPTKDKFSAYFAPFKSVPYNDATPSRGGSSHSLRSIAWNPLGSLIATGNTDKTLRVWNPEKPLARYSTELKGHLAGIEKVAFNPVKDAELCSLSSDGVLKIWDVRTKACVNEVRGLGLSHSMAWEPNGDAILVTNRSGTVSVLSPTQPAPVATHQQPVETYQMAFCWGGKKVFLPTRDGRVRMLSYPDFLPVLRLKQPMSDGESDEFMLKGHTAACLTAELSPTGRYLATGGADSIIGLFDTTDWICQRTVTGLAGPVKSISFTFDGSFVVGGCDEGAGLEVTHTETGEHVHSFKTAGPCEAVAWAPTRYCLAYGDLGVLRIIGLDADKK